MDENTPINLNKPELPAKSSGSHPKHFTKKQLIMLIGGAVGLFGGVGCAVYGLLAVKSPTPETISAQFSIDGEADENIIYSSLTGEVLQDASLKNSPAFCVQTPNGTDGARPQAGLDQAGVVFEAIAEAGITRFAAIYQNPSSAIIGPIRSLRMYYLQWDTPFDCTIVHAGGAADALAAVASGDYKDLTENYSYMYRGTYKGRLWNNLFTTSSYFEQYSLDSGNATSNIQGFKRMTEDESVRSRIDNLAVRPLNIITPADGDTSELAPAVASIAINFGGLPNFNVVYNYDAESNSYLRSYASGAAHEVYSCPIEDLGEKNPEDVCTLTQMAPSVIIAMIVNEEKASDGYHESITTIGSGTAYIFQNGTAISGTWTKSSADSQIQFTDETGAEVALAPGQTMISAIPTYGSVDF